ncbi:MAG: nucleotidyltransferase domain-containing protein [Candidatus Kapabacteria bacterium]|nr:nucleotidyltransferase domain-containing protein [Ignavibacteriota bacterium]MCW5883700.1 nucleotidyltransferase domain-containing protein [Candidatus Kapabacteria bacterium]
MVKESIIKMIQEYISDLNNNSINLSKVLLYGSYANGTENADSDIDLMLVAPEFDEDRDKYLGIIWKLTAKSNYKIEPYPVGLKRFINDKISPVIQNVKQNGIEISIKNN